MSDNINFDYKNLSPFKWFVLENFPFIEADFDALTEWQLFCKIGKEINKIIDSQNIVGEQAEVLTTAFNNLKNYVDNYFTNLDVQDEINNKLNEMAEDGTLEEIITSYINLKGLLCFNNVTDMKNATNLVNNSFVKTFGYNNINDGGGSFYKIRNITNNDVVDNIFIINLNDPLLIAELILENNTINLLQAGITGNSNELENSNKLLNIILKLKNGGTIIIPEEEIKIDKISINDNINSLTFKGETSQRSSILSSNTPDYMIEFNGNTSSLKFEDIQIKCNNISNGIKFAGNSNANLKLYNTTIYNSLNGIYLLNAVYLDANFLTVGISTNATSENFGLFIKGYEYNRFENCAFQINGNNFDNQNIDLLQIEDTNYTWIKNCEFAKTGGNAIHLHAKDNQLYHTYLDNNVIYRINTAILAETTNYYINNLNIINTNVTLAGNFNNENILNVKMNNNKKINCLIDNISIYRFGNVSSNNLFILPDNSIGSISIENISINYTNIVPIVFNNNKYEKLSVLVPTQTKEFPITSDGNNDTFSIIFKANEIPFCPEKPPKPLVGTKDNLINYPFSVSPAFYDNQYRYRFVIKFLSPLPAGNYTMQITPVFE